MYLIKLARFVEFPEQQQLLKEINEITNSKAKDDTKRILVNVELNQKQLNEILSMHGIVSVTQEIDKKETKSLSELIEFLSKQKLESVKFNLNKELPFHEKALTERLKKKGITVTKGNELIIESREEKGKIITRIMKNILMEKNSAQKENEFNNEIKNKFSNEKKNESNNSNTISEKELIFVLVEPITKNEVADFMRLSEVFNAKLFLIDQGFHAKQLLREAGERVKSVKSGKIKPEIVSTLEKAINDSYSIGFSVWAEKKEQKLINLKHNKIALVFGNEKKGLPLYARKLVNEMISLGPKSSQCMRSSQALAYALALINN
ncbi:MAG: hypothetical protein JW703_01060 [Candidatus Diapherotrites archaeon]|nr:hypothetical protein [Candidatus Diapherotrites archaeon]